MLAILYARARSVPGAASATPAAAPGLAPPAVTAAISRTADPALPTFAGLKEPRDAAVDELGRIWIADFGNSRVRLFDARGGTLGGWGSRGDGRYSFRDPSGIAVGGGRVYVADTWNGRIQCFATSGEWQATASGLSSPRGVAIAPDGRVWVAESGGHRVLAFDASLGNKVGVGGKGSGDSQFSNPVGIAVAGSGEVYVADSDNRRIVVLSSDGTFRRSWPVPGWERAVDPYLEIDRNGTLYASDPGAAEAVRAFDGEGRVLSEWTEGEDLRRFSLPTGLALDRDRAVLYVVCRGGGRVATVRVGEAARASRTGKHG
jgi:tripartite motif-containing protein 71